MTRRGDGGRTAEVPPAGRLVVALLASALPAAALLTGCGGRSTPVTIGPGPSGANQACVLEGGRQVCATAIAAPGGTGPTPGTATSSGVGTPTVPGGSPGAATGAAGAPSGSRAGSSAGAGTATSGSTRPAGSSPSRSATSTPAAGGWGGGTRSGSYPTTGTVTGVPAQGDPNGAGPVSGSCDVNHDVRTVTAPLDAATTLVIDVTGPSAATITVRVSGGTTWRGSWTGATARSVVQLAPRRTTVGRAQLARVSGPAASPLVVTADFDC